jgi:hypothetical protein
VDFFKHLIHRFAKTLSLPHAIPVFSKYGNFLHHCPVMLHAVPSSVTGDLSGKNRFVGGQLVSRYTLAAQLIVWDGLTKALSRAIRLARFAL